MLNKSCTVANTLKTWIRNLSVYLQSLKLRNQLSQGITVFGMFVNKINPDKLTSSWSRFLLGPNLPFIVKNASALKAFCKFQGKIKINAWVY